MEKTNDLMRYARQFIALHNTTDKFPQFIHTEFAKHHIYTHPWLGVVSCKSNNIEVLLLGYILNPHKPEQGDFEVIQELANSISTIEDVPKAIYSLSGRFILMFLIEDKEYFFHDPCGLRTLTYTLHNGCFYFASDEKILSNIIPLKEGDKYNEYQTSQLRREVETFIPAGVSLYEDVYKLKANHFLDLQSYNQIRFYPYRNLVVTSDLEVITEQSLAIFRGEYSALIKRGYKWAVTATAGRDSRVLMALAEDQQQDDIHYYTMSYYNVVAKHHDIVVPQKILKSKKLTHHIYDCTGEASSEFDAIYKSNSIMAHDEWSDIAYGMNKYYPHDRLNIKGVAAEIISCYKYSNRKSCLDYKPIDTESLFRYGGYGFFSELKFTKNAIQEWFSEIQHIDTDLSYNILDFYFWEHRIGSWQAQSQLEWDVVQESYTPFNNRELIDVMLSLFREYRRKKNNQLYNNIINKTWPNLNQYTYDNERKGIWKLIPYIKKKLKQ